MAFNVNDEAMDALEAADPAERQKFFEGLTPEERQAIADYVPTWKAKRQPATATGADEPPLQAPVKMEEPGLLSPVIDTAKEVLGNFGPSAVTKSFGDLSSSVTAAQKDADYVAREVLGGTASLVPTTGVANILDPANAEARAGSEGERYAQANLYANNPLMHGWFANRQKLEANPVASRVMDEMAGMQVPTTPLAFVPGVNDMLPNKGMSEPGMVGGALQTGLDLLDPSMVLPSVTAFKWAAGGAPTVMGALRALAAGYAIGTATAMPQLAAGAAFQAPEGQRMDAAADVFSNPLAWLLAIPGALGGAAPQLRVLESQLVEKTKQKVQVLATVPRQAMNTITEALAPLRMNIPATTFADTPLMRSEAAFQPSIAEFHYKDGVPAITLLDTRPGHEVNRIRTYEIGRMRDAKKWAQYREEMGLAVFTSADPKGKSPEWHSLVFGHSSELSADIAITSENGAVRLMPLPEPKVAPGALVDVSIPGKPPIRAKVLKMDKEGRIGVALHSKDPVNPNAKARVVYVSPDRAFVASEHSIKHFGVTNTVPTVAIPRRNVRQEMASAAIAGDATNNLSTVKAVDGSAKWDSSKPLADPRPYEKTVEIPRRSNKEQMQHDIFTAGLKDAAKVDPDSYGHNDAWGNEPFDVFGDEQAHSRSAGREEPLPKVAGISVEFAELPRARPGEHTLSFKHEGRTYDIHGLKNEDGSIIVEPAKMRGGGPGGEFKVVGHNPDGTEKLGRRGEPSEDNTVPLPPEIEAEMSKYMQERLLNPTTGKRAGDEAPAAAAAAQENGAVGNASQPTLPPSAPPTTPSVGGGAGPLDPFIGAPVFVRRPGNNLGQRNYRDGHIAGFTKDGNVIVKVRTGEKFGTIDVSPEDVDINTREADMAGITREYEPLTNVLPQEFGPGVGRAFDFIKRAVLSQRPGSSAFEKITDAAVSVRMRQNTVAAHYAADKMAAQRAVGDRGMEILKSIRQALGGTLHKLGDFDKEVLGALEATRNDAPAHWAAIEQKYPEAWKVLESYVTPFLERRATLEKTLIQLGYLPEVFDALDIEGIKNGWTARTYLSKMMPAGQWADIAPTRVVAKAKEELRKVYEKRKEVLSDTTLDREMNEILNVADADERFETFKGTSLGRAFRHLKARKDLPKWLREAMGETPSGVYRLAMSIGFQEGMVSNLLLMREIANNGLQWSSVGPQPDFKLMPDGPMYGELRGRWVHPDIYEAIVGLPDALKDNQSAIASFMAYWKTNVVAGGGLDQWVHEAWDNTRGAIYAGGVDLLRPDKSARNIAGAIRDFAVYAKNPLDRNPSVDIVQEARMYGAIEPGHGHAEFTTQQQRMLDMLVRDLEKSKVLEAKETGNRYWTLMKVIGHVLRGAKAGLSSLGHGYGMIQQVNQLASYKAQREKLDNIGLKMWMELEQGGDPARHGKAFWGDILEQAGNDPTKVTWDTIRKAARREAARRVRLSFVSPSNLHPTVHRAVNATVGVRAPFIVPFLEEGRLSGQLPRRLAREDDLKWRLGGNAIVMGAAVAALIAERRMNGITDEEVELISEFGKSPMHQNTRTITPVAAWYDEKGRPQYMDLTWAYLPASLLKGDWRDSMWRRVLANMTTKPLEGGPFEKGSRELLSKVGLIHEDPEPYKPTMPEVSLSNAILALNSAGLAGPTWFSQAYETRRQLGAGTVSPRQQTITPSQAVARELGFPLRPVTMQNIGMQAYNLGEQFNKLLAFRAKVFAEEQANLASGKGFNQSRIEAIDAELKLIQERGKKLHMLFNDAVRANGGQNPIPEPEVPEAFQNLAAQQSLLGGEQ